MSPRSSTLLALIGVLLAGIPLPALTTARRETTSRAEDASPLSSTVYLSVQCSGHPSSLRLLHEGREIAFFNEDTLSHMPCETEWKLPASSSLELEVSASWPEVSQAQAVTLTAEPDGLPQRQCTQWTQPGGNVLHRIFTFTW